MTSDRRRPSLNVITLLVLMVVAMGGAWVGFYSGGVADSRDAAAFSSNDPSAHGANDPHAAALKGRLDRFLHQGDFRALDGLIPLGISEVDGEGGQGLNRQVRSRGLWFPVFDLSKVSNMDAPDSGLIRLNQVPLMIATPHPAAVRVNEWLSHRFTAVGGVHPYAWSVKIEGGSPAFTLDATTGDFTGMSAEPLKLPMNIYVTDAAGAQASAATSLVVGSEEPLTIVTTELPEGTPGQAYSTQIMAAGGAQPYVWSLVSGPEGWVCDASTGTLTGTFDSAGQHQLQVTVSDSVTEVQRTFTVKAGGGLEIVTPSPLPPAAPGASYSGTFEAEGGVAPYRWSISAGQIPLGWALSEDGTLTGLAGETESRYEFEIQVVDANGQTFEKAFRLWISNGLLVVPSREKAGLAWQYETMRSTLGVAVSGAVLKRNGTEIYRGQGTNVVDRGLVTGQSYSYELMALTANGLALPYAAAVTTILPMSRQRAQEGVSGDPYADRVVAFNPLSASAYGAANLPHNVTGPPDGTSTFAPAFQPNQVVSLNASTAGGGSIILEFTNNIVESGSRLDFTVFENVFFKDGDPNQRFMEPAIVEVALFEGQWIRFPFRVSPAADGQVNLMQPAYYSQGFAGVNASTGDDPTDPTRSGGDSFDLGTLGRQDLQWFRFIRLTATGDRVLRDSLGKLVRHTEDSFALSGTGSSGFDLDAVTAVNY